MGSGKFGRHIRFSGQKGAQMNICLFSIKYNFHYCGADVEAITHCSLNKIISYPLNGYWTLYLMLKFAKNVRFPGAHFTATFYIYASVVFGNPYNDLWRVIMKL